MNKFAKFMEQNIFNVFIGFLLVLNLSPILAPVLSYYGFTAISDVIYFIYSFTCHQFHWRSVHIFDNQVAWCTRDMFIWGGFLVTSIAVKFKFLESGLKWYWMLPFIIPIALDGGIQTLATMFSFMDSIPDTQVYLSTNLMRMVTGSIFGIGLGIIIAPILNNEQQKSIEYYQSA